jgi:predicted CoA-substrate-specific enzyme activase
MQRELWVGIDVGSTTVKSAVVNPENRELLLSRYRRHNADQASAVHDLLSEVHEVFADADLRVAICGSGGQPFAAATGAFYIQEVVANAIAVRELYPQTRVAIELGGQDAKVVFFRWDEAAQKLVATDMRMNGSCAGGTGAFVDQVAELIDVPTEEFGLRASQGTQVYDISGRCGVFAKTDIQPLLNQGVAREDIALSTFHAIAKQTIGGLAQGMDITPPVIFEGGPLHFNPTLIDVFKERLMLSDEQVIVPDHPEVIVAYGTALSVQEMYGGQQSLYRQSHSLAELRQYNESRQTARSRVEDLFFSTTEEREEFDARHEHPDFSPTEFARGSKVRAYLGIDAGSTTTKFVLLDENEEIFDKFYSNNNGDPLAVIKHALIALDERYKSAGVTLEILGVGTTGYGEVLFAKALKADYHTVETVAHAEAAKRIAPDVSFVLDIGGQDMKAINVKQGIVTGIVLNEACSAGCGSFVETYAKSLQIPVDTISGMAFDSRNPSRLGSRCTVFMNSSIITEQKNGKSTSDIMAGLCRSIVENVFTKVVRVANLDELGSTIVVQGGTFKNDAVLRAMEQFTGKKVVRPPHPGEMGAIGIALLTKREMESRDEPTSSFIGLEVMEAFDYVKTPGMVCEICSNNCNRTVVTFSDGSHYVTGNRCERGEVVGDIKDKDARARIKALTDRIRSVPDMVQLHNKLLTKNYNPPVLHEAEQPFTIGIPRTLEFWRSLPFWKTLFESLGFRVVVSRKSNYDLFESGLQSVPSDTICFPAKLAHGHVKDLIRQGVDRIFMPMLVRLPPESSNPDIQNYTCAVVHGYPLVVAESDEPQRKHGVTFDNPIFHWYDDRLKRRQTTKYLKETFGFSGATARKAVAAGDRAMQEFRETMAEEGRAVLASLEGSNRFAVVLAGRPYHIDELVNHNVSSHFTRMGIPVLTLESLPQILDEDFSNVRMEAFNPFHGRMLGAALHVAAHPNLELVQIVSFGCGHDAIITDEMIRIMRERADKEMLVLKLDEGETTGPMNIRIKSFVETIRVKRETQDTPEVRELPEAFRVKYRATDKTDRVILAPNLSPTFSRIISTAIREEGHRIEPLPLADERAIALGKRYVHNDICFPAQVNIGEALRVLESGKYKSHEVAIGVAKNCEDCRAGHYVPLARKALDEAGYPDVPIITTGEDPKDMHPGFNLSIRFQLRMVYGLLIIDGLERMVRAIRPYEIETGEANRVYDESLGRIDRALAKGGRHAITEFGRAVDRFNQIEVDRSVRKPRVGILGEVLMNFHPTANGNVEDYLERHGMEVVLGGIADFFRRAYIIDRDKAKRGLVPNPFLSAMVNGLTEGVFRLVHQKVVRHSNRFRFAEPAFDAHDLARNVEGLMDKSYVVGEGWVIPGEIIQMAKEGVNSFVILNPFACIPNHITGRGMVKPLKRMYPHIQILSLDFDPDTSFANIENRLQMLIISARELENARAAVAAGARQA